MDDILFEAKTGNFMFRVYSNRFEYETFGMFFNKKTVVVPKTAISKIEGPSPILRMVTIKTLNGEQHKIIFNEPENAFRELLKYF